ncbi:Protein RTA1 [Yarrowia sp. B02]|nr:Protein RTA1 [Yarrowia sp. B02]
MKISALIVVACLIGLSLAAPPSAEELGMTEDQWSTWVYDQYGVYGMRPSRAANLVGMILFIILWAVQGVLAIYYRQWWFGGCVFCGICLEFLGYLGRFLSTWDLQNLNEFILQIVCLTLAPAFIMAGVYCLLAKFVVIYGESYSRVAPLVYTIIFVCCDLISIVIQAIGGGISATALYDNKDTDDGTHIMVAGMAFQVFTMSVFFLMTTDFLWRVHKGIRNPNVMDSRANDPEIVAIRESPKMKYFVIAVYIAFGFVFTRSVYRVVELAEGWYGNLLQHEAYLLVLDGLMMLIAIAILTVFYPGFVWGRTHINAGAVKHSKGEKNEFQDVQQEPYNEQAYPEQRDDGSYGKETESSV